MNYRHAFHAGNFADVIKHAVLMQILRILTVDDAALNVVDTHAGAGMYDLASEAAAKSAEAQAGVMRLLDEAAPPAAFAPYIAALGEVRRANRYPGSPVLTARALRGKDRLVACELNPRDYAPLEQALKPYRLAQARLADGYGAAVAAATGAARLFVHIDPPYETSQDYTDAVGTVGEVLRLSPAAQVMVWAPLKDLDTFDRFLTRWEEAGLGGVLVGEVRLRPLDDPMRMNGCALVLVNAPPDLRTPLEAICAWSAQSLGESGAKWRVFELS